MTDEERVLRCAYEESALWELAAEVGSRARAQASVLELIERGLVALYRESGWPRIRREAVDAADAREVLAAGSSWEMPAIGDDVRSLHARFVGLRLTEAGARRLQEDDAR